MTQSTYSRARPSARYVELIKQYELMHCRGDAPHDTRSKKTFDGVYVLRHAERIKELIDLYGARTLLDYGCGKGRQYANVNWQLPDGRVVPPLLSYWGCTAITCYEPAFPLFARLPTGTFDAVICTDVLEHCPHDDLTWIMDELFRFAEKFVFANVACYPAKKRLPNGENVHCTVKPVGWWQDLVHQTSRRQPHVRFYFELESSRRGWDGQMVACEAASEG